MVTQKNRSVMLSHMDNFPELPTSAAPEWPAIPPDLQADGIDRPLSKKQLKRWGLVLEARGIPFRNQFTEEGWFLRVPPALLERSRNELRRYEELNHNWPPPPPVAAPQQDNLMATLCVLIVVASFHNLTLINLNLAGHNPVDWSALGNADARKILQGEWWRLITALTLHADWLHLFSNLAIGGLFINRADCLGTCLTPGSSIRIISRSGHQRRSSGWSEFWAQSAWCVIDSVCASAGLCRSPPPWRYWRSSAVPANAPTWGHICSVLAAALGWVLLRHT
jgi:hypothetical protein